MRYLKYILLIIFTSTITAMQSEWQHMQQEYTQLIEPFHSQIPQLESFFMHPYWKKQRQDMAQLILGAPDQHFLHRGPIAGPMVRKVWCSTQDYEMVFLQHCISEQTKQLISRYRDTSFGGLTLEKQGWNCSINALGQLFFLAKLLDRNKVEDIQTIMELGGGYGALARITKTILPSLTYIIIDLPEYLAIQGLYLRSTMPEIIIKAHTCVPTELEPGIVHLIPVFLLREIISDIDIFISIAALSETPQTVQELILQKRFFNAKATYLTGQLNKWGPQHNFEHHSTLLNGMRQLYSLCIAQPLHHFGGPLNCYEIYGTNH
jgi:putative sugar O-methyltransferase